MEKFENGRQADENDQSGEGRLQGPGLRHDLWARSGTAREGVEKIKTTAHGPETWATSVVKTHKKT